MSMLFLLRPPKGIISLDASGPVSFSANGQIIENLEITSTSGNAVTCNSFNDCTLKNCKVLHEEGRGVAVRSASLRFTMTDVDVVHTNAPASGPHTTLTNNDHLNVLVDGGSHDFTGTRIRIKGGSTGIYVVNSDNPVISFLEGHDVRGPFARGQLVQFNTCDTVLLQDFSYDGVNGTHNPEDNVNATGCATSIIIRRGVVDFNDAPSGAGIQVEGCTGTILVEDVDALHQMNTCLSITNTNNGVFRRTRIRDNFCTDQGRGDGQGIGWLVQGTSIDATTEDGEYFNLCGLIDITDSKWKQPLSTFQVRTSVDFTARSPISLTFPWE